MIRERVEGYPWRLISLSPVPVMLISSDHRSRFIPTSFLGEWRGLMGGTTEES